MRRGLAEKLLIKVMNWSIEDVARERPLIQAMARLKYDEYQQFSPGIRFTESLAQWLSQFSIEERSIAYEFIKSNLIFISSEQISHLVNICFPEKINPVLIRKAADWLGVPRYLVKRIHESLQYKEIKRRSLFLAISDGAKIDQLRRSSGLSNEQVFSSYYISNEKKDDLLSELRKENYEGQFNSVFLIDDFTGSGLSYARIEKDKHTGKVIKFLNLLFSKNIEDASQSALPNLIDSRDLDFHVIFYIAREDSIHYLTDEIERWKSDNNVQFHFSVDAIQVIRQDYKMAIQSNSSFEDLCRKYITRNIIDRHYEKGKHEHYYLGFDECALPLVLHHNTPNNSLPLLWWYPEEDNFRGLFPRVTRHRE